jgi:hypothetical protein
MSECSRPEIRDRLPDLIHERLDAATRADVMGHLASCATCGAELELLRAAHAALVARTPRVDVAKIVGALPKPPQATSPNVIPLRPRRRWTTDWKIAAAITVIAVGGGTFAVTRQGTSPALAPDSVSVPPVKASPRSDSARSTAPVLIADSQSAKPSRAVATASPPPSSTQETASLEMTGRLGELSDAQLEALLRDIDKMQAVPITEPEPVILPVTVTRPERGDR